MTRLQVEDVVKATIAETFNFPPKDIIESTVAADIDGWDSLSHTILMVRLQNRLGVSISEEVAAESGTVGALIDNMCLLLKN